MTEIEKLIKLSKYAGERFDLVQAGGGNTSVKLDDGMMLIKASGFMLSDVDFNNGYSKVDNRAVLNIFKNHDLSSLSDIRARDNLSTKLLKGALVDTENRPSIETFLHSLLYRYTLHTHPLILNAFTCKKDWKDILTNLLKGNIAFVDYKTPGFELGCELKGVIERHAEKPKLTVLQNHGLITSSDSFEEVFELTEDILNKLEDHLGVDMQDYKLVNKISALINSLGNTSNIAYLSFDFELNNLIKTKRKNFFSPPFCPDGLVYCGVRPLEINNLEDRIPFLEYHKLYLQPPRVVIYDNKIFFVAQNLKKAREIEDVFKFHIMTLCIADDNINYLSDDELMYLNNWEAEKFRQKHRG
jgi:rhamnose utilization protein RhaD (predicted bifunctional aldolase and dehydrogenase)